MAVSAVSIQGVAGEVDDVEGIHDCPCVGEFFGGRTFEPDETIQRNDLNALTPRIGAGGQPGFENPLGAPRDDIQESGGTTAITHRRHVQDDGDEFVAVWDATPHMSALPAPVAAHAHIHNSGTPPVRLMCQAPAHRVTQAGLALAASTPPVLTSNTARQHRTVWLNTLAGHFQARSSRLVNASKSGRSKVVLAMSRYSDEQCRNLPYRKTSSPNNHNAPNPDHHVYILNDEAPHKRCRTSQTLN